jgi:hypothetical protein
VIVVPPFEMVYQYVVTVLDVDQRVALCARLLGIDVDILRAWLARRREHLHD